MPSDSTFQSHNSGDRPGVDRYQEVLGGVRPAGADQQRAGSVRAAGVQAPRRGTDSE